MTATETTTVKVGDRVLYGWSRVLCFSDDHQKYVGFHGVVRTIYDWNPRIAEVRLDGGTVAASISELRPLSSEFIAKGRG